MSQERKELLARNEKNFSSFSKGFKLSEIISDTRVSHTLYSEVILYIFNGS